MNEVAELQIDPSTLRIANDSFRNLVANLGTDRDKQAAGEYAVTHLTETTLVAIYRTSWMGKKIVDIPAQDATRKWREWQAEAEQIAALEAAEKALKVPQRVKRALQLSRLLGGSAIYFSIDGQEASEPLDLETVRQGSLKFITVLRRGVLQAGEFDLDPMSETFGKPMYYSVSGGTTAEQRIHPSRLVLFHGIETLEDGTQSASDGFGDSVLQAAYEAVRNADSTASNTASLVYEAKVDILGIPDLTSQMANPKTRALIEERVQLSALLKGNNGMLVRDSAETYDQKAFTFAGLPDINYQALQSVSGAADIPLTRFLGQSPAGLSSTGESDLKNYYDSVNSMQTLVMTPAMERFDEALIRSTFGNRPEDIDYIWASLWQMSDEQKSEISGKAADMIKTLSDSGLFHPDDLAPAAANLLVEHSILPSFELKAGEPEGDGEL